MSSMKVIVDDNEKKAQKVLNGAKVVLVEDGYERHVNVTSEGIIIDIVVNGEVEATTTFEHDDLLMGGQP